jgi:LysR family transcriptional regulator, transcriptional activator of nhaA
MEWLNYHHLQCFWLVARKGGLVPAAKVLFVSTSTVWTQLKALESHLGLSLLEKKGRKLHLTSTGERVARLADSIFALGKDVLALSQGIPERASVLRVGLSSSIPRLVSNRIVGPALSASFHLKLHHASAAELIGELVAQRTDVVITDELPTGPVRLTSQLLESAPIGVYGVRSLFKKYHRAFPQSLQGAPMLLPPSESGQRQAIDSALAQLKLQPDLKAEVDDSALLKTLASSGYGLVCAPTLVTDDLKKRQGLLLLGTLLAKESYFAVTLYKSTQHHPALEAILAATLTRK